MIWYVLHNSPEIDTYQAKFKIEFPNKDMKEEFPGWFEKQIRKHHVDNDPGVNESSLLFALACGPSQTPISVKSFVVNGVRSICKSIGLRSVIRIDHQELKKVIWYVLHNSPEIDTYRVKFKSQFPNKDMKEEFPGWSQIYQRHLDKDLGVSASSELFALACGPTLTPISVNSCVVNGVRFVVHNRDERRITQNSGICSPGEDEEMYYGQLEQILEFSYMSFKTMWFRVKWRPLGWKFVEHVNHKKFSNEGVIVVEDNPDIIHVDNSSDLALNTTLNDLEITALHINGQSINVDAPPDIIDVDEDDDIIDDEDVIPYDLADSDDEDLVNVVDDDGVAVVYSSEEED
nr:proton-dependent oligopeptide transporter family [Tanacetum cinerariifolium]